MKSDGSYYHLYNRGNNKGLIFFEEANYIFFLQKFKHFMLGSVEVMAYCLMPNHFHFFIQITDTTKFDKSIKNFFISYSKAINKRYDRVGSLFQGRYKSKEITSNDYFSRIITYIHQNPTAPGLGRHFTDYNYSSYQTILSTRNTLVQREKVLEWFGGRDGFIEAHKIIVQDIVI